MQENNINMRFRDVVSVSLLFAALENSFPHFLRVNETVPVDTTGKDKQKRVFLALKTFSTNFPQIVVDRKR